MNAEPERMLMKKAGALLARRPHCRAELRKKLLTFAGELPTEAVLDRLEQLNLLNDADYAYNFALRRMLQDGWGPERVQLTLLRRGIDHDTVRQALGRIEGEQTSVSVLGDYLDRYLRSGKDIPRTPQEIRKLIMHLRRRGFDEESILPAVRRLIPDAIWRLFETGDGI